MVEIEKPKIEIVEISEHNRYGKFVCEPLERGSDRRHQRLDDHDSGI